MGVKAESLLRFSYNRNCGILTPVQRWGVCVFTESQEQIELLKRSGLKALGYCRISKSKKQHQKSLENMIFDLESAGCDLVLSEMVSGYLNRKREEYDKALDLIRDGQYQIFVIPRIDRLGRRFIKSIEFEKEISQLGCKFFVLDFGCINTHSPQGWFDFNQACLAAEYESRRTSYRIKKGKEARRRKGQPNTAAPIHGYRWNEDKTELELDKGDTYEDMRSLLGLYFQNEGNTSKTCRDYKKKTGNHLHRETLIYRLQSPTMRGHVVHGVEYQSDIEKQVFYNQHPALITPEESDRIDELFRSRTSKRGRHSKRDPHPLQGLMRCRECGQKPYRKQQQQWEYIVHHSSWECNTKKYVNYRDIVNEVNKRLIEHANEIVKEAYKADEIPDNPAVEEKKRNLKELQQTRKTTGLTSLDPLILNLQNEITALSLGTSVNTTRHQTIEQQCRVMRDPAFWEVMDDKLLRGLYYDLIDHIEISGKRITNLVLRF